MVKDNKKREIITKMRPGPDFKYLARKVGETMPVDIPLARNVKRDPGEIPGFYAEEHGE
ncbi:MAG: hypothetical protein K6T65_14845 [Peptococcaceae bacterium]|nr:hypothetical protein [Peptococcaceae bacterium]